MTAKPLIHSAAQLATLHEAAPELLVAIKVAGEYLDRVYLLPNPPAGLDFAAKHIRHVLRLTRGVHVGVPTGYHNSLRSD